MQWTLFLVVLMGQCSFSTCSLYQYYFIRENKTWDEAQTYCRETYTDLATVSDMTDMRRLCSSTQNQDEAWIGLHSYPGRENRKWHWSLPGLEFNDSDTRWQSGEPNDAGPGAPPESLQNCVTINNQLLYDDCCKQLFSFFCFNGTKQSNTFHNITTPMTWPQAQNHCRHHYTDLVSGLDQLDHTVVSGSNVWIGLFRDTWRWSDGSNFSFRNWESLGDLVDGQSDKTCATVLNTAETWSYDYCNERKPFYCYEDNLILINQSVTWVEALEYCRENHHDLVSITNANDQRWVQERIKNASTDFVWLGLRYTCTLGFWFWVSDEVVDYQNYQNWASNITSDDCDMSAAINTGNNKWFKKPDNETFNFFCTKI
ncbi:macrophage mannose receptor 1-like [Betta splendens]|uniref:Macrophage mannose receptor 1-like n=1 Tax=Betta splendens TaxID=158456 RepID=A0A9W2XMQ9_BETSP|nr:macrophage mannose receptor 1-like [Betta splendens]